MLKQDPFSMSHAEMQGPNILKKPSEKAAKLKYWKAEVN